MSKRTFTKRILAVALSIIMVLGLMPMTVFAYPGDGGDILTSNNPGQYDMDGRPLLVYVTPNGGYVSRTSGGNSDSTQQFTATAYDGWVFSGWRTYYEGPTSDGSNPNHTWDSEWCFSKPGDSASKPDPTSATIQVNREWDAKGTYYLYALFRPIITVRIDEGVEGYLYSKVIKNGTGDYTKNLGGSGTESRQISSVQYGYGLQFEVKLKDTYVPVRVSVNGVDKTSEYLDADSEWENGGWILFPTNSTTPESDADMLWLTGPVTVEVTTRLINCIVQFDANGGNGAMTAQTFSYGETQALNENRFSKAGYTFAGWNTKADRTGTAYADKQSVSFTPVNDGDSITLYAQWTECTVHSWENGVCHGCGAVCSHSGGTATCTEQAACSECGMKYGDVGKHKVVYTASENSITETCENNCGHNATATITAPVRELVYDGTEKRASVSYSDGWQGGTLIVTYSDGGNINAGKVTASIEKGGVKASVDYTIDKINPNYIVPTGLTATYGQTLASIGLPEGWTWDNPAASVGDTGTNRFKAIFTPADTTNYNAVIADVDVTVGKAVITITADNKTAKQYEELPQFTFTATGLIQGETLITNPTVSTKADMKSAGTFEIIATGADAGENYTITYVPGTLTVEAHTEHSGGTATCKDKAVCTACGQSYGEKNLTNHTGETGVRDAVAVGEFTEGYTGDTYCLDCGEMLEKGENIPAAHIHGYDAEWKSDSTSHWHECSCGAKMDVAAHSGGGATCKDKAVCTACGQSYGEKDLTNHTGETGVRDAVAVGEFTEGYTGDTYCLDCGEMLEKGENIPAAHIHGYAAEWKSDSTSHWHECSCGAKMDVAAHSGGGATCKDKAVCTACGQTYGELTAHAYENGKCTVCGAANSNYALETDSPKTGDNSHMTLWLVLIFISGGAILTMRLVERKRRNAAKY